MTKLASSQLSRQMGQRSSSSVAMPSACCDGLTGAGDVEPLPPTSAAAAGVVLAKEEKARSLTGLGRGGRNGQVPQAGSPPSSPGQGVPSQLTSAAASVPPGCPGCLNLAGLGQILQWLRGWAPRAEMNNSLSTTTAPRSCSRLQPRKLLSQSLGATSLGEPWCPNISSEGQLVTTRRLVMSLSVAGGHRNRPPLPASLTPAVLWPQHTCPGLPQSHSPRHPPISWLVLSIGVSC